MEKVRLKGTDARCRITASQGTGGKPARPSGLGVSTVSPTAAPFDIEELRGEGLVMTVAEAQIRVSHRSVTGCSVTFVSKLSCEQDIDVK